MDKIVPGTKVDFQNAVYVVAKDEGDSLLASRQGSNYKVSIPKSQAKLILEEGRSPYNVGKSLNG